MRFSIAIGALPGYPIRTALAFARRAEADGVELMLSGSRAGTDPGDVQDIAEQLTIPILSVHATLRLRPVPLPRKILDDRASVRYAGAIPSCEVLVLHPPLTGPRPSPDLNRWLDAISRERDEVRQGLKLAIENRAENYDGTGPQLLDDFERLRALAGEWGMCITLDLAHAASQGHMLLDAIDTLLPKLANVHVSDQQPRALRGGLRNGLFRDHRLPGSGTLPIAKVLDKLNRTEYKGLVTLELSPVSLGAWWPGTARRRLREALTAVRIPAIEPDAASADVKPGHRAR